MHHLMIDFETLGTTPDCVVISLGACLFTPKGGIKDDLYIRFDMSEQLKLGRKIDSETLEWWMSQSDRARAVFKEKNGESIRKTHAFISRMLMNSDPKKVRVWCKGLDFDVSIINDIFGMFDQPTPWKFWNVACFRTFLYLTGIKVDRSKIAHNALDDARAQAQILIDYFNRRRK